MDDIVIRLRRLNSTTLMTGEDFSDILLDGADEITRLRAENEMLRAQRDSVLLDAAEFFGWFNRHCPAPSSHPEHPWCAMGMRLSAYADELTALAAKGD